MSFQRIFFVLLFSGVALAEELPQDRVRAEYDQILQQAPATKTSLTADERTRLLNHVYNHPVASFEAISKYDHQPTGIGDREIGFCYGRAMAVNLAARRMGLASDRIQKLFIAGDLRNATVRWRFHMTTIVPGDDGKWYVIDPLLVSLGHSGVSEPAAWMEIVKRKYDLHDGVDDSHFFVTDTRSIMADMSVIPANRWIESQDSLLGDRIINATFEPHGKAGFEPVAQGDIVTAPYELFRVTGAAQDQYFVNFTEPDFLGKPVHNFDFFRFSTVILFQPDPMVERMALLPRTYDYNSYFVNLIESFKLDKPLADL